MPLKVKNVEQGYVDSRGVFHPIRASSDYDEGRVYKPKPKAKKRAKKRAVKKAVKKTATRRKTTKAPARKTTGGLRAYALAASRARGGRRGVAMSRNPSKAVTNIKTSENSFATQNKILKLLRQYDVPVLYNDILRGTRVRLITVPAAYEQQVKTLLYGMRGVSIENGLTHYTKPTEKNPIPATWTKAKVMRTRSGDVKVMLTR